MTGLPLNINIQQIFLHMLNFAILFGGLYFLLYKPVKAFMDKRTAYFADMDKKAQEKKAEADQLEEEYKQKFLKAEADIDLMKANAAKEAAELAEKTKHEAEEQGRKIVQDAHERALKERERMVNEAKEEIIEIAIEAERKLLHEVDPHE